MYPHLKWLRNGEHMSRYLKFVADILVSIGSLARIRSLFENPRYCDISVSFWNCVGVRCMAGTRNNYFFVCSIIFHRKHLPGGRIGLYNISIHPSTSGYIRHCMDVRNIYSDIPDIHHQIRTQWHARMDVPDVEG